MIVCLEVTVRDWESRQILRSEIIHTGPSGEFSFAASIHELDFFEHWQGYSVRVTDPKLEVPAPCGTELLPAALSDMRDGQKWKTNENGTIYFPVAVVEEARKANPLALGAMRRKMGFPMGMHITMIPLLQDINGCQSIQDRDLGAFCRELNNSAAADLLSRRMRATA
jgi:hypothetical protein